MIDQTTDLQTLVLDIKSAWDPLRALPDTVAKLSDDLQSLRRSTLSRPASPVRQRGQISDDSARALAGQVILTLERRGLLESLSDVPAVRDSLREHARHALGLNTKAALTTGDIPLPTTFDGEFRSLISEYGVARTHMQHYPIGRGTARPARVGTRPAFGSIAMSALITEKSPTLTYASLESHKIGGIVRLPREIDEQSMVSMGRFLAHYGAIEFARIEDVWAFQADGSATYELVKGIITVASDNGKIITTAAGKTKPSDVTLADLRNLRNTVNKGALSAHRSAYYMDSSWGAALPGFRTAGDPNCYQVLPDGTAVLDGYPIIWTDVLEPYGTAAAAGKAPVVFGALRWWWFGEHGHPRIDTNESVWFANDQLAVRFIEEVDFDYAASDATAALVLAAA